MSDKENVTIFIVTHNNRATIRRAIESVTIGIRPANQVVVCDNDSKDDTYDILCQLLGAEKVTIENQTGWPPEFDGEFNGIPIRIFRKRLSTIGHSTNIAMQMKWQGVTIFGFMDPTSWYSPNKIQQSIEAFNINPSVACVVSDCDNRYPDGSVERLFRNSFDAQKMLMGFQYDRNFLIRPPVFSKLQSGFNEQLSSLDDYELLLRISEIGLIYHLPLSLHHNTIVELDELTKQSMSQSEIMIRQLTEQRRRLI